MSYQSNLIPYRLGDPNSCYYYYRRPQTTSVSTTSGTSTTTSSTTTSGTGGTGSSGSSGIIDIGDVLEVSILNASTSISTPTLTVTNGSIQNITTSTISSFEVGINDDVTFRGSSITDKLFWDSSLNTLYIDGLLKIRDSSITLNNDSSEVPLTSTDGEDKGFFFKWYDGSSENLGFMGFDLSDEKFTIYSDTTVSSGEITSGTIGNFLLDTLEAQTIKNYSSNDLVIDVDAGQFDIMVTGTSVDTLNLYNATSSINITSDYDNSSAILLDATSGGIDIDANDDINLSSTTGNFNININSSANILNFNESDGLTVSNSKTDYKKWFSYKDFDIGITGVWITQVNTSPNYLYWEKDLEEEISILSIDLTEAIRDSTDKGLEITRIYFHYDVSSDTLNDISTSIVKKTLDSLTPSAASSYTTISVTDGNLESSGLGIGDHYRYIDITSTEFLNDDEIYTLFISFDTKSTTLLKFFGCMIYFNYNHL